MTEGSQALPQNKDSRPHIPSPDDFRHLDGSLRKPVAKQLKKLETSPLLGEHLGNTVGLDLTGYYKLYAAKKGVRIVYRVLEQEVIVEVVAIGKREDLTVYQTSLKRISSKS